MSSFKVEVIADASGKWTSNSLRFATAGEARGYAHDLSGRWTAVRESRIAKCDKPVNYLWADGRLQSVVEAGALGVVR